LEKHFFFANGLKVYNVYLLYKVFNAGDDLLNKILLHIFYDSFMPIVGIT